MIDGAEGGSKRKGERRGRRGVVLAKGKKRLFETKEGLCLDEGALWMAHRGEY